MLADSIEALDSSAPLQRDEAVRVALCLLAADHEGIIGTPVQVVYEALSEASLLGSVEVGGYSCELHRVRGSLVLSLRPGAHTG
jgi:hypothetical protein